jgi:hypothetical protein
MSHECPDCGELCFCNGDIDDCCLNTNDSLINCTHYKKCGDEDMQTGHEDWEIDPDMGDH